MKVKLEKKGPLVTPFRATPMRAVCLSLALLAWNVQAQVGVNVEHEGSDLVGSRLVFEVREQIAASRTLRLDRGEFDLRIKVRITTMTNPLEDADRRRTTVYNATLLLPGRKPIDFDQYLSTHLGVCGGAKVKECASGLVALIASNAEMMEQAVANARSK